MTTGTAGASAAVRTGSAEQRDILRLNGGRTLRTAPFLVAGILNVTPDSFSDGGQWADPVRAVEQARQMLREGAHILDLGAESTRPGAADIGPDEERRRLFPVLERVLAMRTEDGAPSFCLSIDTRRAQTAAGALEAHVRHPGAPPAEMINDISGGAYDPAMDEVLATYKPAYVLGHCPVPPEIMRGYACPGDVVDVLLDWFTTRLTALVKAGLPEECVCLDPCIGFGKSDAQALRILSSLPRFAALGRPLYIGISRKGLLGAITGLPPDKRDAAAAALSALLLSRGARIHRTHNVEFCLSALKTAGALHTADEPEEPHSALKAPAGGACALRAADKPGPVRDTVPSACGGSARQAAHGSGRDRETPSSAGLAGRIGAKPGYGPASGDPR
ncbi:MAG: dihydropteroate synthase [Desulfovibrio sp.]|nr:dihydropteroate synthase [Desulfovibrio sp.]